MRNPTSPSSPMRLHGLRPMHLLLFLPFLLWLAPLGWIAAFASGLNDDAFISFRYARNLLEGQGLAFNPGERVEGYTNFLWVLELAAPWVVAVALHYLFRYGYYGEWLPNTYHAKFVRPWYEAGWRYLLMAALDTGLYLLAPLAVLSLAKGWRRAKDLTHALPLLCIFLHMAHVARMGGDLFGYRLLEFYWPLLAVPAAAGIVHLGVWASRAVGRRAFAPHPAATAAACCTSRTAATPALRSASTCTSCRRTRTTCPRNASSSGSTTWTSMFPRCGWARCGAARRRGRCPISPLQPSGRASSAATTAGNSGKESSSSVRPIGPRPRSIGQWPAQVSIDPRRGEGC